MKTKKRNQLYVDDETTHDAKRDDNLKQHDDDIAYNNVTNNNGCTKCSKKSIDINTVQIESDQLLKYFVALSCFNLIIQNKRHAVDVIFIATSTVSGGSAGAPPTYCRRRRGGGGAQRSQLRERKNLGLQFILEISKPELFFPFFVCLMVVSVTEKVSFANAAEHVC